MLIDIHTHFDFKSCLSIKSVSVGSKSKIRAKFFSAGIHPWFVKFDNSNFLFFELLEYSKFSNFVAWGEIGLDKNFNSKNFDSQLFFFERQIIMAQNTNLPVIIHCVGAFNEILNFRKKYNKNTWISHDFYASEQIAKKIIDSGVYLALGNNFLRKNSKIELFLQKIPSDFILFETDIHYFSIKDVYSKASEIKRISFENLETTVENNFEKAFKWKP